MRNSKKKKINPELKEALKNEVAPLLIGIRNDLKTLNEKQVPVNELEIVMDGKKLPVLKGKDGVTPVADKDYLSKETALKLIDEATPRKGIQYFTEKEIKEFLKKVTPVKGKDYKDGTDGVSPKFDIDEISKKILGKATPIKGVHYRDGIDGVTKTVVEYVDIEPKDIRNKLESLKGNARLSVKAIKGIEELIKSIVGTGTTTYNAIGGSGGTGGGSGTPAGSNREIQINNSGSFGTLANFKASTSGFGYSSSSLRGIFDVKNSTTIGNVSSGSASFSYGSGNYTAEGFSYQYKIYAYTDGGAQRVFSTTPLTTSLVSDDSSLNPMKVNISWSAVTGASGYRVLVYNEYTGLNFDYYYDTTSTSFVDGDGTEASFVAGNTVTPTTIGPNFYIDSGTGNAITNRPVEASAFNQNSSSVSTLTGPLYINSTETINPGSYSFLVNNPTGGSRFGIKGALGASFNFRSENNPTNEKAFQFVANNDGTNGRLYLGFLNDAENGETPVWYMVRNGTSMKYMTITSPKNYINAPSYNSIPTAGLHLGAGSTAAQSAPLKFSSGALMTTPEVGAVEYLTDKLYITISTAQREEITLNDIALTSGRVPFTTTNGRLTDSTNLQYTSGGGLLVSNNLKLQTAGNGIFVKEGTNATMGVATLVAGTVVVSTTKVTANSRIFLTAQSLGTVTIGQGIAVSARTAGTSFTILSQSAVDTSTIAWLIIEPS